MNISLKALAPIAAMLAVIVIAGCSRPGAPELEPQDKVSALAQQWADALLAGDWESAYAMTSPNYRQFSTLGQYRARIAGASDWYSAQVHAVNCSEELCEVRLLVGYELPRLNLKNERPIDQRWVLTDGQWRLYVAER